MPDHSRSVRVAAGAAALPAAVALGAVARGVAALGTLAFCAAFACADPVPPGTPRVEITQQAFEAGLDERTAEQAARYALRTGDAFPQIGLRDQANRLQTRDTLAPEQRLVVVTFRGSWCPYCVRHLADLEAQREAIEAAGGRLVALTPERSTYSERLVRDRRLGFPVLHDRADAVARQLRIAFKQDSGRLDRFNGDDDRLLPIPAVYIVETDGTISFAHIDPTYRHRLEPGEIIAELRRLETQGPPEQADRGSLQEKLDAAEAASNSPEDVRALWRAGIEKVEREGVTERARQAGDRAPDFVLPNARGEGVRLRDLLRNGPVVLTWYRGGWCPYCNITLRVLQERLGDFESRGAQLVAISPELPDNSLSTAQRNNLAFEVLSDEGNRVASDYRLTFRLHEGVAQKYDEFFSLKDYNGDSSKRLPLAATYVIDTDGVIRYAFLDADYTKRAEPDDILAALDEVRDGRR